MQSAPYPDVPPDFGHWLAGFIDGEGCFDIHGRRDRTAWRCRFAVRLRDDDGPILHEIRQRTGLGRISEADRGGRGDQLVWQVQARVECIRLAQILDRCPLRAKKARDYAIWREALGLWCCAFKGNGAAARNRDLWPRMAALGAQLREGRAYHASADLGRLPEVGVLDAIAAEDQLLLGEGVAPGEMP